jgi:hypothetical protein
MTSQKLIDLRRKAEKAVSDMPDGELRVKAFEVILNSLLHAQGRAVDSEGIVSAIPVQEGKRQRANQVAAPTSTSDRILSLKGEDFFEKLRTIGEVREQLASHGWHYPATALSGPLQELVQRRELRRQRISEGKRKVWKYSNP